MKIYLIFCIISLEIKISSGIQDSFSVGHSRAGCVGEFSTFGFLTFLISLLNTLLNMSKISILGFLTSMTLIFCCSYYKKHRK